MPASQRSRLQDTFAELDVVRLRSVVYVDDVILPTGSVGTIVFRHIHGEAYEVEFTEPVAVVLTLRSTDLAGVG